VVGTEIGIFSFAVHLHYLLRFRITQGGAASAKWALKEREGWHDAQVREQIGVDAGENLLCARMGWLRPLT